MKNFNDGKPYHGSSAVAHGQLQGATAESDNFYFFCPDCSDKNILRILGYEVQGPGTPTPPCIDQVTEKAKRVFTLVFQLHCEQCKFTDFMKISNTGWQIGKYADIIKRRTSE